MAITTNETVNIQYNNVTVDTYELSDTLDNYTVEEIKAFLYCSWTNKLIRGLIPYASPANLPDWNNIAPFSCTKLATNGRFLFDVNPSSALPMPDGCYTFTVWLQQTAGDSVEEMSTNDLSNFKMITKMNAPRMKYTLPNPSGIKDNITSWSGGNGSGCYATEYGYGTLAYMHNIDAHNTVDIGLSNIQPYFLIIVDNDIILHRFHQDQMTFYSRPQDHGSYGHTYVGGVSLNPLSSVMADKAFSVFGTHIKNLSVGLPYDWNTGTGSGNSANPDSYGDADDDMLVYAKGGGSANYDKGAVRFTWFFNTKHGSLLFWAGIGVKFYADKLYKPIIEGGYVTGYTDDLDKPSDLDEWDGSTKHDLPVTPPAPPAPDAHDNEIDVNTSQFAPDIGFVHYIEMDYETIINTAAAFNEYNASIWNIGGDLFKNLISYKIFATSGTHSGTSKPITIAGHTLEYEGSPVRGNYISDLGVVDLGSIDVGSKFRFNDWRDYAPYTKIECFVPCCGWAQLPPWVMGKTVTGTLYIDIGNGSCKAVIFASRTPVAEIGGCCAIDVPLSNVATGAKAAGVISAITNGAVAAFNPTPQNLISGSFGILSALNANYTETKGTMGDGSNINGCTDFLIKVTRPAATDTSNGAVTDIYKHTKGIPAGKTVTLAKGDGFTQITDANITGDMTSREKQMIIDGFRHGLIL